MCKGEILDTVSGSASTNAIKQCSRCLQIYLGELDVVRKNGNKIPCELVDYEERIDRSNKGVLNEYNNQFQTLLNLYQSNIKVFHPRNAINIIVGQSNSVVLQDIGKAIQSWGYIGKGLGLTKCQ